MFAVLHVFEIKKHAKLLFAQCSPVSYFEKKNKKIKNQTQHHKKEKDIKIITIMKKQNKLNKKNIEIVIFHKTQKPFFQNHKYNHIYFS